MRGSDKQTSLHSLRRSASWKEKELRTSVTSVLFGTINCLAETIVNEDDFYTVLDTKADTVHTWHLEDVAASIWAAAQILERVNEAIIESINIWIKTQDGWVMVSCLMNSFSLRRTYWCFILRFRFSFWFRFIDGFLCFLNNGLFGCYLLRFLSTTFYTTSASSSSSIILSFKISRYFISLWVFFIFLCVSFSS